jgi:hypothetical protein
MLPIIYRRTITAIVGGVPTQGAIRITQPVQFQSGKWACQWAISFIHDDFGNLYGDDPIEAIERAITLLERLVLDAEADGLRIWRHEEGDHCGFAGPLEEESRGPK